MDTRLPANRRAVLGFAGLTGAAGALASSQAAHPQPAPASARGLVDPRSFGARADGATDDSAALRAAAATGRAILIEGPLRIDQTVDLPPDVTLLGSGVYRSTLMLGPAGKLRLSGQSFERRAGGALVRDLTIAPIARADPGAGLELRHLEHVLFDNVTFYRLGLLLDDHHYLAFRECRFFGDEDRVAVVSNCESQPRGHVAISEAPAFSGCHFSSCPVTLYDTVDARFTDCVFIGGARGIRSGRRLSRGSDAEPFFMGPAISGCVFDSIAGPAIEIEGGGTDCRVTNSLVSAGRTGAAPGIRLVACSGVELIGNRFEWCGSAGLALDGCERIGVTANSFANMAGGPGITARGSCEIRVTGNAFENRPRWGGSGAGRTTLAVDADAGCTGWAVTGNTAAGLLDPRVATLRDGVVANNPGWPAATERGWPGGTSADRPQGVADGYRWYDETLGLWLHWHGGSGRWRDPTGRSV